MKLRLAISACLLGAEVRWNGGHKRDTYLTDIVGPHAEFVPFCPEDAALGTPRPPLRMERVDGDARAITQDGVDHTDALAATTPKADVHGIILMRGSPSCGLNVAVWENGKLLDREPGIVARRLTGLDIPVTEGQHLRDGAWREHFFDQAFCWLRWEQLGPDPDILALQAWHARHKLTLMAHHPDGTAELGRLAAKGDFAAYRAALPGLLKQQSTRGRHANVLQHIQGYISEHIDGDDREELLHAIDRYRSGTVPLLVPMVLLQHHVRKHAPAWLKEQTYLDPYPAEWMLRA